MTNVPDSWMILRYDKVSSREQVRQRKKIAARKAIACPAETRTRQIVIAGMLQTRFRLLCFGLQLNADIGNVDLWTVVRTSGCTLCIGHDQTLLDTPITWFNNMVHQHDHKTRCFFPSWLQSRPGPAIA